MIRGYYALLSLTYRRHVPSYALMRVAKNQGQRVSCEQAARLLSLSAEYAEYAAASPSISMLLLILNI